MQGVGNFLSKAQTEGATEYKLKASTIDFFSRLGISLTEKGSPCSSTKSTVGGMDISINSIAFTALVDGIL